MRDYIVVHSVRVCTEFVPETYGRLTTIGPAFRLPYGNFGHYVFCHVCTCVCGKVVIATMPGLRRSMIKSCGCLRKKTTIDRNTTHGMTATSEYRSWASMKNRCDNRKGLDYLDYGGRGIVYCDRWKKFENFLEDMGLKPGPNYSIERKNNHGNYEPDNCCWAERGTQNNNTRANHLITLDGITDTLANWCRHYGVPYRRTSERILKLGWKPLLALTTPDRKTKT